MPRTPDEELDDQIDDAEDQIEGGVASFTDFIQDKPIQAVIGAAVLGFVLAKLVF